MDEAEPVKQRVTCRTEGCLVEGRTFVVDMYPNAAPPIWRAQCGQCERPIADIVPA